MKGQHLEEQLTQSMCFQEARSQAYLSVIHKKKWQMSSSIRMERSYPLGKPRGRLQQAKVGHGEGLAGKGEDMNKDSDGNRG